MYFVIIMAFALVLSDDLPPRQLNIFGDRPPTEPAVLTAMLAFVLSQIALVAMVALVARRRTLAALDGTPVGQNLAIRKFAQGQFFLLGLLAGCLMATIVCTPWASMVRRPDCWNLDRLPLVGDLLLLAPFFLSLTLAWGIQYRAELRLKGQPLEPSAIPPFAHPPRAVVPRFSAAAAALASAQRKSANPDRSVIAYVLDKFRHHVLIIAVPMTLIVFVKHFTDRLRPELFKLTGLPWLSDALLGLASITVLVLAPVMLRYVWSTEPLPAGPLRDRFVRTCQRIDLRYREILLWHTHGLTVNAAVMGFIPQLRYILVSDALLETMDEEEIEAVFGHEAGHIHHWHLPFFGAFAATSMYVSGGFVLLLERVLMIRDYALLQLGGLGALLFIWLFGFGWLSRRFERQADLFGVRCVTPDVKSCLQWCPVHGTSRTAGLCVSAANLFGRTLSKIAGLNGIPRRAPSWRHGSIESRCRLIEQMAADPAALTRFDRYLFHIKIALAITTLFGTIAAAVIYYESIARALGWR